MTTNHNAYRALASVYAPVRELVALSVTASAAARTASELIGTTPADVDPEYVRALAELVGELAGIDGDRKAEVAAFLAGDESDDEVQAWDGAF